MAYPKGGTEKVKANRAILEAAFPREYVRNGLNATKAYKALKQSTTILTARVEGSKMLAKPSVQRSISELLDGAGLDLDQVTAIHKRNMTQSKQLSVSQTAVQDAYKLHQVAGFNKSDDKGVTNIAIVIDKSKE